MRLSGLSGLSLLLVAVVCQSHTVNPDAAAANFSVAVDWSGPPAAVSPAISSWHDTALGATGNPRHDTVYPPSMFDIVEPIEEARRQLRAPYVRLWSGTSYFYAWPNSTRVTAAGPAISPPNTTETCRFNFPNCSCCREYCAIGCACCPGVPATTSWDFRALDINVKSLQSSTAFPETNILQIVGVGANWFFKPGKYMSVFADPTGGREGRWFSNILDWYCRGGFTDERGEYHHSGHNYTFGYLELLNEMDLAAGPGYIRWYDGVVAVVRARHPTIKFIGNCHALQGQDNNSWTWRQFLDRNEHMPEAVWPVDAVSFHGYSGPSCGYAACSADPTNMHSWVGPLVDSAKGVIADATEAAHVIKTASPKTKIFMDEVGILLGIAPFNMSDTLGNGSLSTWWNIQAVVWALFIGELAAAGVDMVGASQFVGWPCQAPWYDHSHEQCTKGLFEPSPPDCGQAAGNYPEMSVIDWTNGKLNARGWAMKLLIDGLGNGDKAILQTNVSKLSGGSSGNGSRTECRVKTEVVDQDMQGGDICEFNMTSEPSHAACGRACCENERCDHFVSVRGDPPWSFKGGGVCAGRLPCAEGGFCCFLKTNATRAIKSNYKPGTAIGGTTTPSHVDPGAVDQPIYARAFAPSTDAAAAGVGGGWPGPEKRAVLLANFDSRNSHTVSLAGDEEDFRGATLWSVVHGVAGAWDEPFARRKSTQETLTMEPLAVYLAFLPM